MTLKPFFPILIMMAHHNKFVHKQVVALVEVGGLTASTEGA
jgi:hypothetical protein